MPGSGALCVGHISYDLLLPLDRFPEKDTKAMVDRSYESGGGPAYNAAALVASWGLPCVLAGVVGADAYGKRALEDFIALGGDASGVRVDAGAPTPLSVILSVAADGSRTIVTRRVPLEPLDGAALLAGLGAPPACLLGDGHEAGASAAAAAAFPGTPFVLDAGSPRPGTELLLPLASHCIVSERYASSLLGGRALAGRKEIEEALDALRRKAVRASRAGGNLDAGLCAVTLGSRGWAFANEKGAAEMRGAHKVETVDSTGAGDLFHGAFAWALASGLGAREGLELAGAAAALSVARRGGFASIPALADARALAARS